MQPCWAEETSFKTLDNITDPNLNTMRECYNKCINRAVVIIIIIIIVLLYFILQNNSKITIITFMNVDGVLAFSQLLFWQKPASFCWLQQIYKWLSLRIWEDVCRTYHIVTCLVKIHKNVTEQLTSNTISAQIFPHALHFEPWLTSR